MACNNKRYLIVIVVLVMATILVITMSHQYLSHTKRHHRIVCMVTTQPNNHRTKAKAVADTWGQKCDFLFFVSSKSDQNYPIVEVKCDTEDHNHLWCKNRKGFLYGFDKYENQFDWFVKADDDTYMVIDNLRLLLDHYVPSDPLLFGLPFKYNNIVYPSGGMTRI